MDENVRANEVEEIETETEVVETSDSNASALLMGFIGGCIACAVIGGVGRLRVIAEEKWAARKLAESTAKPVGAAKPGTAGVPEEPNEGDEPEE